MRRTISPYDLTAAENPGGIIYHPLLRSKNYEEWPCSFKTVLISRKKFGFLDGTIPKPKEDSPDLEDCWTVNALLVSWLKMSIHDSLRSNISLRDVANDLWDHLKKRFSVSNGPRNQQIKADLANCNQHGMTVEEYYGKLTKIMDNISGYIILRVCKCGHCECDLGSLQEKDRQDDQVQQFLYGLNEKKFQKIRSSLTALVPLLSLKDAYNAVR